MAWIGNKWVWRDNGGFQVSLCVDVHKYREAERRCALHCRIRLRVWFPDPLSFSKESASSPCSHVFPLLVLRPPVRPPSGHTESCPFGRLPTPNCPSRCKCECGCLFAQRPLRQTGDSPTPRQLGRTPVTATLSPGAAVIEAGTESRVSLWPISSKLLLINPKM